MAEVSVVRILATLVLSLAVISAAAEAIVLGAVHIAHQAGLSEYAIGATVVAIGTTLPDKPIRFVGGMRGQGGVVTANALGSNVFLLTLVLGLAAVSDGSGVAVAHSVTRVDLPLLLATSVLVVALFHRPCLHWRTGSPCSPSTLATSPSRSSAANNPGRPRPASQRGSGRQVRSGRPASAAWRSRYRHLPLVAAAAAQANGRDWRCDVGRHLRGAPHPGRGESARDDLDGCVALACFPRVYTAADNSIVVALADAVQQMHLNFVRTVLDAKTGRRSKELEQVIPQTRWINTQAH